MRVASLPVRPDSAPFFLQLQLHCHLASAVFKITAEVIVNVLTLTSTYLNRNLTSYIPCCVHVSLVKVVKQSIKLRVQLTFQ